LLSTLSAGGLLVVPIYDPVPQRTLAVWERVRRLPTCSGSKSPGKRPGGGEPPAGRPPSPYPEKTPDGNPLSDHLRGHRDAATRLKEVPPETIDDVLRKPPLRVDSDGASVYFDAERNVTIVKNEAGEVIMARRGPPGKPR
jgi:hypothetical protein